MFNIHATSVVHQGTKYRGEHELITQHSTLERVSEQQLLPPKTKD